MSLRHRFSWLFIFLFLSAGLSMAAETNHIKLASQLVDLTFNKGQYHDNAMRYALLAIKDRYENNPKTKPYSDIIIKTIMEVMETYINDANTEKKVKQITAHLYMNEFSESELREMIKFYRTKVGQKMLSKAPIINQKQWELESQLTLPPKYEQMVRDKFKALQEQGKLPESFQ